MMRDAMCQIVRYSQLMTLLTRLPWTLTLSPHLWLVASDDNTGMWVTKKLDTCEPREPREHFLFSLPR